MWYKKTQGSLQIQLFYFLCYTSLGIENQIVEAREKLGAEKSIWMARMEMDSISNSHTSS